MVFRDDEPVIADRVIDIVAAKVMDVRGYFPRTKLIRAKTGKFLRTVQSFIKK